MRFPIFRHTLLSLDLEKIIMSGVRVTCNSEEGIMILLIITKISFPMNNVVEDVKYVYH